MSDDIPDDVMEAAYRLIANFMGFTDDMPWPDQAEDKVRPIAAALWAERKRAQKEILDEFVAGRKIGYVADLSGSGNHLFMRREGE